MIYLLSISSMKATLTAPPMGWNSWMTFAGSVTDEHVKATMDALVSKGLVEAGYEYLVLDDGVFAKDRTAEGNLQPNTKRFPTGFTRLLDLFKQKNIKPGYYSCAGTVTATKGAGSLYYEEKDA